MQKIRRYIHIFLIFSILLLVSCGEYDRVLKSTDYAYKYRKALQYYNKKQYGKAVAVFEQIINVYRATMKGDSVMYYYAKSYYGDNDFIMAGNYFGELSDNYGRSPFVEESDYMVGYCFYLISPRPSLDQEDTHKSIQAFQKFLYKHPDSKYIPECKRLVSELNAKLAEKAFLNARMYYDLGYYKASLVALRNCINEYPESEHREELMYMILKSNFLLAENSVPEKVKERFQATLDEYYSFVSEYSTSKYSKDVEKMYTKTKQILGL
jgi:outer membrane protein assembly factor BamD